MRAKLMAGTVDGDVGESYAYNIVALEKELGSAAATNESSLILKYFTQLEYLLKFANEEKKQMDKSNKGTIG